MQLRMNDLDVSKKFHEPIAEDYYTALQFITFNPETALMKFRCVAETLCLQLLTTINHTNTSIDLYKKINILNEKEVIDDQLAELFHRLRKVCNKSVHRSNKETNIEMIEETNNMRSLCVLIFEKIYCILFKENIKIILVDLEEISHDKIPLDAITSSNSFSKKYKAGLWYEAKAKQYEFQLPYIVSQDDYNIISHYKRMALEHYQISYQLSVPNLEERIRQGNKPQELYEMFCDVESLFRYALLLSKIEQAKENNANKNILEEAYRLLKVCSKRNHEEALIYYAIALLEYYENYSEAFDILSQLEHPLSHLCLYFYYSNGKACKVNPKLSCEHLFKACEYDDIDAKVELGIAYDKGKIIEKNLKKSKELLDEAVSKGNKKAKNYLENEFDDKIKKRAKEISDYAKQFLNPIPGQEKKISRNELCHCGSGKKYKKCCLV